MSGKGMSLKAKIRNFAEEKNISAQAVLQNYMFERFLERISKSRYKDNFIIKGGMLIASIVGIDNRSTMDMDATIKNYPMNKEALAVAMAELCNMDIGDGVHFAFMKIDPIRQDDLYGGYRVRLTADYDTIITPLLIDISKGDAITPREISFSYKALLTEQVIELWAYNIETVLAEKVETILVRGEQNTRPRDFYDVYILVNTQKFDEVVFAKALKRTAHHRGTEHILETYIEIIKSIEKSEILKDRWLKYSLDYHYTKGITYEETTIALKKLMNHLQK